MEASPASTPSIGSSPAESVVSTRSGYPPGTPQPPINPPRRRSSLAFSQTMRQGLPAATKTVTHTEVESKPMNTPSRALSNVGRKRALVSPLTRSTATPGHVAQMQKIFSNAKASLQLDMRYAASPAGSIGSRLPPASSKGGTTSINFNSASEEMNSAGAKNWRYSTAPFQLTDKENDVREPFPENSSLLPNPLCAEVDQGKVFVAEPISSGFTSPVDDLNQDEQGALEGDPLLPTMPPTEKLSAKLVQTVRGQEPESDDDYLLPAGLLSTELEQSLTDLDVNNHMQDTDDEMEDSPIVNHLKRQSGGPSASQRWSGMLGNEIILSTPARAAAESAKAKRGILRGAFRASSNKENVTPCPDSSTSGSSADGSVLPCPNPGVHDGIPVALCPDPSLHYRSNTPGFVGHPDLHAGRLPSPSPLRASLHPPVPPFHRATSTGSPMPMLKGQSQLLSPGSSCFPRHSYLSAPGQDFHRPPLPVHRPSHNLNRASTIANHFQPGWYYAAPPPPGSGSKQTAYAFSTAAAKVVGSSPAPDSRIRDSYRTDTLTPLARPTSRFRKNGIGAVASRGAKKYYGNIGGATEHGYGPGPPARMTHPNGGRTLEKPRSMSSPPRPCSRRHPMPKRRRTRAAGRGEFAIVEDETAGPRSKAGSIESGQEEPMEIDEDIRAAVRMSIGTMPEGPLGGEEEVKELTPNVTPYRKGTGPQRERRPSYWDEDLEEVMSSPARKIGGHGRESMRGGFGTRYETQAQKPGRPLLRNDMRRERRKSEFSQQLGPVGKASLRPRVSFNEEDLSGEMKKAGDALEKRLSGRGDVMDGLVVRMGKDGC